MGVTFIAKEGTYTAPATLTTKTITENGTYSAVDDSANGYSSVTVEVEGGGGSSDLTTAEMIVDNIAENPAYPEIYVPCVAEPNWDGVTTSNSVLPEEDYPNTVTVILYKGKARLYIPGVLNNEITLEGNITRSPDDEFSYYITGDCKITLNIED